MRAVLASGTHAPGVNEKGGREPWDHTRSGRLGKRAAPIQYGRVPTWSTGVHARGNADHLKQRKGGWSMMLNDDQLFDEYGIEI